MQLQRNEILTGLLVVGTIGVIAFLLVLLGAPGLFRPLVTYGVYFDNAAGIKPGAVVMLAGRKIGQVQKLYSPLTPAEEKQAQQRRRRFTLTNPVRAPPHRRDSKRALMCRWTRARCFTATPRRKWYNSVC